MTKKILELSVCLPLRPWALRTAGRLVNCGNEEAGTPYRALSGSPGSYSTVPLGTLCQQTYLWMVAGTGVLLQGTVRIYSLAEIVLASRHSGQEGLKPVHNYFRVCSLNFLCLSPDAWMSTQVLRYRMLVTEPSRTCSWVLRDIELFWGL